MCNLRIKKLTDNKIQTLSKNSAFETKKKGWEWLISIHIDQFIENSYIEFSEVINVNTN